MFLPKNSLQKWGLTPEEEKEFEQLLNKITIPPEMIAVIERNLNEAEIPFEGGASFDETLAHMKYVTDKL